MGYAHYSDNGRFAPRKVAYALRTTRDDVAHSAGLGRDAVQRKDRVQPDKTQKRLREMVEILHKVEPRFGSALAAYAWYRCEPLAGFCDQTAMQWVLTATAGAVLDDIEPSMLEFMPDCVDCFS